MHNGVNVLTELNINLNDSYYNCQLLQYKAKQIKELLMYSGGETLRKVLTFVDREQIYNNGIVELNGNLKQGIDFDNYSDDDILLMMNHINNTKREKLDGDTPFNKMVEKIGIDNIKKLGIYYIAPKDIILNPSLFKNDNNK